MASDFRSVSLAGPTVRPNASITISTARHDRGRGLRCFGSARLGDHALAGLLFDWDQEEEALSQHPVSTSTPGVWGTAGGGSASRVARWPRGQHSLFDSGGG